MKFVEMLKERWNAADTLLCVGLDPDPAGPAQFAEFIKSEIGKWAKVVQAVGLKPE